MKEKEKIYENGLEVDKIMEGTFVASKNMICFIRRKQAVIFKERCFFFFYYGEDESR